MWLMRTVTRVVETCPTKMLRELLSALQEGLSVWIADQYRVFTAEEYVFDVSCTSPSSSHVQSDRDP